MSPYIIVTHNRRLPNDSYQTVLRTLPTPLLVPSLRISISTHIA